MITMMKIMLKIKIIVIIITIGTPKVQTTVLLGMPRILIKVLEI